MKEKTIKQFDKGNVREITNAMLAALSSVGVSLGIEIESNGCTYTDSRTVFRFEARVPQLMKEEADTFFSDYVKKYGITLGIGTSFKYERRTYTIVGVRDDGTHTDFLLATVVNVLIPKKSPEEIRQISEELSKEIAAAQKVLAS
jgi:hypothetical protein